MCTGSCDSVATGFVTIDQNIAEVIVKTELQETVTRMGDCPSIFVMVIDDQTMFFCVVSEMSVVVSSSSRTVLNVIYKTVVVYHLMQQSGTYFFDGTGKGTGTNVDLVGSTLLTDPRIITEREVAICFWCGLNCNGRS